MSPIILHELLDNTVYLYNIGLNFMQQTYGILLEKNMTFYSAKTSSGLHLYKLCHTPIIMECPTAVPWPYTCNVLYLYSFNKMCNILHQ